MKLECSVRSDRGVYIFLNSHGEDQENGTEHLDEQSTLNACLRQCAQCCAYRKRTWEETRDNASCCDSTEYLSDDNDEESHPADCANQSKSETYLKEASVPLRFNV